MPTENRTAAQSLAHARADLDAAAALPDDPHRRQQYALAAVDYAAEAALATDITDVERSQASSYLAQALAIAHPDRPPTPQRHHHLVAAITGGAA